MKSIKARFVGEEKDSGRIKGKRYNLMIDRDYVVIDGEVGFHYDVEDFLADWLPIKPGD